MLCLIFIGLFEGTVRLILSDPPCKMATVNHNGTLETLIRYKMMIEDIVDFLLQKYLILIISPLLLVSNKWTISSRKEIAKENKQF